MVKNDCRLLRGELINQRSGSDRSPVVNVDRIDNEIIGLLLNGRNNKEISTKIRIPLSTVQRRVRNLISKDLVTFNSEINYQKFGFKLGMLHIYLEDGDFERIADRLKELDGIISVEVHIGNSDLIANVIYKHSIELLELIAKVKSFEKIDKIVWSEMIYKVSSKKNPIIPNLLK